MVPPSKNVTDQDRFRNTSSAPSCVKVRFKDTNTGAVINAILGADELAHFLASERGFFGRSGRIRDLKAYRHFMEQEFVDFMLQHDSKPTELSFERLNKFDGKRFGEPPKGKRYTDIISFGTSMTFNDLGVNDEAEFLDRYFDFDASKGYGTLKGEYGKYTRNPAFIALLIDLGYDAGWGDPTPFLWIRSSVIEC